MPNKKITELGTASTLTGAEQMEMVQGGSNVQATAVRVANLNRISTTTSTATLTPAIETYDTYQITAQAEALAIAAPTGTPYDGQGIIIRIKDNGTARAISYNAIFRAIGVTLPTATVISKTVYLAFTYNSTDTKWDCIGVRQES